MGHFFLSPAVVILLFLRVWNSAEPSGVGYPSPHFRSVFAMPSCGKLSQIVKAIRRKRESQMLIRERAAIGARAYNADVLRQKSREWLAKSAVNRIREDPEAA